MNKIRYKVVTKNRKSCIVPENSKFCLTYKKGTVVKAIPNTFGIMVFKTHWDAMTFANQTNTILKVRPIGRKKIPRMLSGIINYDARENTDTLKKFYKYYHKNKHNKNWFLYIMYHRLINQIISAPTGTECYPAVEVLE